MSDIVIYKKYRCKKVICTVCGKEMYRQLANLDDKPVVCKQCHLSARNKANAYTHCKSCGVELTIENEVRYGKDKHRCGGRCKECYKVYDKAKRLEIKRQVVDHYGGKCTCCGEDRLEFLTVDHINGDGGKHRKENKWALGTNLYSELLRKNFDVGYELQVLCWNCNLAKAYYGKCPHQT